MSAFADRLHALSPERRLYTLQTLPTHLAAAGQRERLRQILATFDFLQAKVDALGPWGLIADYETVQERSLRLIQGALRLSEAVLADDSSQLPGQLLGRLSPRDMPEIQDLLEQAVYRPSTFWLRPLGPTLTPAGGSLLRTVGPDLRIRAVALTPDGQTVVSGSLNNTLMVWRLASGELVHVLEGPEDQINDLAITPDGRSVVVAVGHNVDVWDLEDKQLRFHLEGHTGMVNAVAVTPDGRLALSGSYDGTLKLWALETGTLVRDLRDDIGDVTAVAVSADGGLAVTGSSRSLLRLWSLKTGRRGRSWEGHQGRIQAVAPSPGQQRMVSASIDCTLKVWDLSTPVGTRLGRVREVRTLEGHGNTVNAVAITPDGRRAISASDDQTLRIWDLESGQTLRIVRGHSHWVRDVAVTPDGRQAVSCSEDGTLRVWDISPELDETTAREGSSPAPQHHSGPVYAIALTADGQKAISGSEDGTLIVWEVETGRRLRLLGAVQSMSAPGWTPDGRPAVSNSIYALAVTPDGQHVISGSREGAITAWDLGTGNTVWILHGHDEPVLGLAVTPDGRTMVSRSHRFAEEYTKVWDLESGEELHVPGFGAEGGAQWVAMLNGQRVLSVRDGTVEIRDLRNGEVLGTLKGHRDAQWLGAVAVSTDGRMAITGSGGGTARLWDLERGREICTCESQIGEIKALALTPDGRRAVLASSKAVLQVWDLQELAPLASFYGDSSFLSCAVAPDGVTIIAGEHSGRVHFLCLQGPDEGCLSGTCNA